MENRRLAEKKYKALLVRRLAMESLTSVEEQELKTLAAAVDADGSVAEALR
ncbi:hypothetical protein [Nitritalea halalkaliphila]|uniref:hypothetical protein n=1 Tax=Nitritalea halalkaliphila TaxID=590849 RepID=UPI000317F072|nr:hypothetical protein [Nitritalea halalkaliphila]